MTIHELKINRLVHLYLGLFGGLFFCIAAAECYLLWDQLAYRCMAVWAMAASYWFEHRMVGHAKRMRARINEAISRARLHESLDNAFENVLGRTREQQRYERRRSDGGIIHKKAA